jgi:hypothetical protein
MYGGLPVELHSQADGAVKHEFMQASPADAYAR